MISKEHIYLAKEGITLTIRPKKVFHWKSQGEERASNSMDKDDLDARMLPPETPITYEEGKLTSVEHNYLHVPKARIQVALDSFLKLGAFLYIFQFTVVKNHDIKKGIENSLSRLQNI